MPRKEAPLFPSLVVSPLLLPLKIHQRTREENNVKTACSLRAIQRVTGHATKTNVVILQLSGLQTANSRRHPVVYIWCVV